MSDKVFVDTNVLIYAHDVDAGLKHAVAQSTLRALWNERVGVLSPQVLQEFYVNVTRKLRRPLERDVARLIVSTYSAWCIDVTPAEIAAAFRIENDARIGFWDALIVASAMRAGATQVLTEDLNAGQVIAGVTIANPFAQARR